jgi:hemerythrin-like domain-containing protein
VADTATPGTDVIDLLTEDHREVLDLIAEIRRTADAGARRDLADTVIGELIRHAVAEEMYVYPAMRDHLPNGEEAAQHDTEEHEELERTLKELEGVDADDPRFVTLLDQLEEQLRHHVSEEEGEHFPALRRHVPREDLVDIAGKVENAKKISPTRPHPSSPNSEVFHKLVGPGVGMVDRMRDKLSGRGTA